MKKFGNILVMAAILAACKPEIKPIGPSYAAGEGIVGSWELVEISAIDISLPVPETRDQSRILNDEANRMLFTINDDGTYTIDQQGVVPDIYGTNGDWMFDKSDFPTMVYFVPDGGDTLTTALLNMPRKIDNTVGLSFTRNRCDKDYVTLQYTFNRK